MGISETRRQTYELFEPDEGASLGRFVDLFIMTLITANVAAVIIGTVDSIEAAYGAYLWYFEIGSVAIFTIEYMGRVWSAVEDEQYSGPITGRLKFASQPLIVVDFLAIVPFYLALGGVQIDLRFLRALRLVRLFRVLKLARYSSALQSFGHVFQEKKEKLILALFANLLLLVLAASAMYYIEHPHQPEEFASIPATFYWAVVTLTTVGYGDVTPITPLGKIFAGLIAVLGIGLFALPASILASGFMEQAEQSDDTEWQYCPHCGEQLDKK